MHLPCLFLEKQDCGKVWNRITSDLGVLSKHSDEKSLGSGLMGSYVSLREGEGLIQRTWNSVCALLLPAPKHMQGLRVPSSCPGHRQQQTRQDARTKEAGLEFGQP